MKIIKIPFHKISYTKKSYDEALKCSLQRISFAFPITVEPQNGGYACVDGHKRLSAIASILKTDPGNSKVTMVPCILINDKRAEASWDQLRHH